MPDLAAAVHQLAAAAQPLTDADLGQPYRWLAHDEGARFALLGSIHELRALAVALAELLLAHGADPALARA